MTDDDGQKSDCGRRRIGLWSAAALVAANMIGAGVFVTSGRVLADLHEPTFVLLAWALAGALAVCGALSYGALARALPQSGGEYHFLRETIHPLAGFLAGWISLLAGFTAPIAIAALGLQAYLPALFGKSVRKEWIGTAAILIAALMHGLTLRRGLLLQNCAVAVKLVLMAGFIALGAAHVPALASRLEPLSRDGFDIASLGAAVVVISFSYCGWNAAVYVGGEVRDPDRNLHRSLLLGTIVVTTLYLAMNSVFLWSAPASKLAGEYEIGAIAARALGGEPLVYVVRVVVALALFTSISAMVMAGPRVYARMAEDGLFPRFFATHQDVPARAVFLQAILAIGIVWFSELGELLGYAGFTLGVSSAATVCGLVALRRRLGADRVPVPGYPWVPGLFVSGTLAAVSFLVIREPEQAAWGLVTFATGVPAYWVLRRRRLPGSRAFDRRQRS